MIEKKAFASGVVACLLAASAAQAAVKPPSSPLQEKVFRHPDLKFSSPHQPLSRLQPTTAAALGQELAALGVPADRGFYDVRAGRWGSLILSEPLIPGSGKGNALRWEDLGLAAQPDAKDIERQAWAAFQAFLQRADRQLRVDPVEFDDPRTSVRDGGALVHVFVPRAVGGVTVRDSHLSVVINHGNLVFLGLIKWGPVETALSPAISADDARGVAAQYSQPFEFRVAKGNPQLELIPTARDGGAADSGGYVYRLAWVVRGSVNGDLGTWEALVDAANGELLAFEDRNQHEKSKTGAVGGVFPFSNDGQPPDGVEQPGFPMPFADITTHEGKTTYTNSEGVGVGLAVNQSNLPQTTLVSVREVWQARYDGGDVDFVADMAVDAAGNVHVTGQSYATFHDILTVKYDPLGTRLWIARYDGPGHRFDAGNAVAVDPAGNVYVTGSTENANGVSDYVTLKYGPGGNLLWERRYDGGAGHYDAAADLVLDEAGAVYVTGTSDAGPQWGDYLTIKYGSDGNLLWTARTSGDGGHHDRAGVVRLDAGGNVYVTGEMYVSAAQYYDFGTVKYDPQGRELWVRTYDSPKVPGGLDAGYAMEVDAAGNAHVTGESLGTGPGCCTQDWATLKYDTDGDLLWVQRQDGSSSGQDIPSDLVLDRAGNVIVTGQTTNQTHDVGTIKYSPAGNVVWKSILDLGGLDEGGNAVTVDDDGNIYVAANRDDPATYNDWYTFRLNRNGQLAWSITHNGPADFIDVPVDIAVHGKNFIYVAGSSWGNLPDYMTIKYRQTGPSWQKAR